MIFAEGAAANGLVGPRLWAEQIPLSQLPLHRAKAGRVGDSGYSRARLTGTLIV